MKTLVFYIEELNYKLKIYTPFRKLESVRHTTTDVRRVHFLKRESSTASISFRQSFCQGDLSRYWSVCFSERDPHGECMTLVREPNRT